MGKVSIIIPTYNCGQYIRQAIESALSQTYKDREIIVVDDGSSDNTYEIIKHYEESGSLRYIYQENRGLPGARNTGIQNAQGEFVVVLDADDELDERMISLCLEQVEKEHTDWCVCDVMRIERTGLGTKEEVHSSRIPKENIEEGILLDDFIKRAPFFRKRTLFEIGLYDEDMCIREDWDINIRMILGKKLFSYVPEALYIYKIRSNSLVKSRYRERYDYTLKLLKKHHKSLADGNDEGAAKIYAQNLWRLGKLYLTDLSAVGAFISCIFESTKYDFSIRRLLHPFYFFFIKHFADRVTQSK